MNLDDLYRLMRTTHVQAQGVVDTVREPLLVLDRELTVPSASRSFYEAFGVGRDETLGRRLYELGDGGSGTSPTCATCSRRSSPAAPPSRATRSSTTSPASAGAPAAPPVRPASA